MPGAYSTLTTSLSSNKVNSIFWSQQLVFGLKKFKIGTGNLLYFVTFNSLDDLTNDMTSSLIRMSL